MRIDDLQFFKRLAELGSLSAAGREFGLSPSAASSRLSSLEQQVGAQLVARTTRRNGLTEAGRIFLHHASVAVDEMSEARKSIDASEEAPRGKLKISSNVMFGRKHILPYLAEFHELHPDVRLEMDMSDRMVDVVEEGYDVAIRGAPLPDSTLIARKLGGNPRVLCASPDHIARKGVPKTPSDLSNFDCIGLDSMPTWFFNGPNGELAHTIEDPIISGDSGDFGYDAALLGLGLTVKSIAHVWEDLRDGRLIAVLQDFPIARAGQIYAVYPPAKFIPPKTTSFVKFLISKYGRPPYWETDYNLPEAVNLGTPPKNE